MYKKYLKMYFLLFLLTNLYSYSFPDLKIIKNPKPNIWEKKYVRLFKFKTISEDLGNGNFLFWPCSLTIDEESNIYAYDKSQAKIFKFTKGFKLIKIFGRKGIGPGEFSGTGSHFHVTIKIGRDGKLYANDARGFKIIVFDLNGNHIKDFKIKRSWFRLMLVDKNGNFYAPIMKKGLIGIFNKKMELIDTLIDNKEKYVYLFQTPSPEQLKFLYLIDFCSNFIGDLTLNSSLIIYLLNSSKIFIIKNRRIVRQFSVLPDKALKLAQKNIKEKKKWIPIFAKLFVDEDDNKFFYLVFSSRGKIKNSIYIYKLNLRGELIKVLYVPLRENESFPKFQCKKNGIFYALNEGKITLYREDK